jgi:mercuric ion transport protein
VKTTSKSGTGIGVLAGIACVACCALPVLITAGVLSGASATFLADKMPIIAAALAILAVLAFGLAARRGTTKSEGSCSAEGPCGCTPAQV